METFQVGESVRIIPDFSNDGFDPFVGTIVEIDAPGEPNPVYYVRHPDGDIQPWMPGNVHAMLAD
jgi:hypothetical protein